MRNDLNLQVKESYITLPLGSKIMLQHKEESGSSGEVGFLALPNEFTKIFIYSFLEGFC